MESTSALDYSAAAKTGTRHRAPPRRLPRNATPAQTQLDSWAHNNSPTTLNEEAIAWARRQVRAGLRTRSAIQAVALLYPAVQALAGLIASGKTVQREGRPGLLVESVLAADMLQAAVGHGYVLEITGRYPTVVEIRPRSD